MLAPGYSYAAPHSCIVNSLLADECHNGCLCITAAACCICACLENKVAFFEVFFSPAAWMGSLVGKWLAALLLQFCDGWSRVVLKGHVCFGGFAEVFWKA